MEPHIPVVDKSKREDGTFSREDFRFVRWGTGTYPSLCLLIERNDTTPRVSGLHVREGRGCRCCDATAMTGLGQTRTPSSGAARPLLPSADMARQGSPLVKLRNSA